MEAQISINTSKKKFGFCPISNPLLSNAWLAFFFFYFFKIRIGSVIVRSEMMMMMM